MSDDLTKKGPKDASKINVNEPWELKYWTQKFKCSDADLKAAVKAVGVSVIAVQTYLQKNK
ncbi:DUF3606 domain-containing protein [Sulfurospirillum sp.]|uniref:DUF3606 domain-containing protein n=1 Tax=Sulfurospirillum sp. TaxID=2053622 RepID=UPI002FDF05D7